MRECIVLAGGMGTRLRSVVADLPKCMAPINERPFLYYIFEWLKRNAFDRVVLSLGYKAGSIIQFVSENQFPFEVDWVVEEEPLGTGGAMALSLQKCKSQHVFIINGDTFFDINIDAFFGYHALNGAALSIAAKPLTDYDRYGSLLRSDTGRIVGFTEKKYTAAGIINGGIYLLDQHAKLFDDKPGKFSFETDILEKEFSHQKFYAYPDDGYFIDIGIPDDYNKAIRDFKVMFG